MTAGTNAAVRTWHEGHVSFAELNRPPNNFFDEPTLGELAETFDALARDGRTRAVVLCSAGKHFCAGADLLGSSRVDDVRGAAQGLYAHARRILAQPLPVVAAVQGAAIGGGLGLALSADFRVAARAARFSANFSRLGFHPGFGLTVTLPRVVGAQHAADLLFSGRTVDAEGALAVGLCDDVVDTGRERGVAAALAGRIAEAAPLAVRSIRATLRQGLAAQLEAAIAHELDQQIALMKTEDWHEGIRASRDRRAPQFTGR